MGKRKKPLVGISGCLLGEEIRYDGQHKMHPHAVHDLSHTFDYISFCPEVSMGLGIPRPPIKLVMKKGSVHLVDAEKTALDHTALAKETFQEMAPHFDHVSGFIFTHASPSCGYLPLQIYESKTGRSLDKGPGLWASYIQNTYPLIPKIDSVHLHNDHLRKTFTSQVLCYSHWKSLAKTQKALGKFHQDHQYYFLQYGQNNLKKLNTQMTFLEYGHRLFQTVFQSPITAKKRAHVIDQMTLLFEKKISKKDEKVLQKNVKAFKEHKLDFEMLLDFMFHLVQSYDLKGKKKQKIFDYY
jgi:uncharacterized protein YbbK (DUF523 family)/uncharacterized protein YbgA (DUF1722 family)